MRTETDREHARIAERAEAIFRSRWNANLQRVDRLFAYLMMGQWVFALAVALTFSPYAWTTYGGIVKSAQSFDIDGLNLKLALGLGGALSSLPIALAFLRPGWIATRYVIACAQMLWSALLIHLTGGRIETHFHVFGSLAFLAFYRYWPILIPATVVVAADHFVRGLLWPESVYGMLFPEWWRFLEHAFWVVFEDVFLVVACIHGVREMRAHASQQARIEVTERLEREMEIAARIQSSLVPGDVAVKNMEVAACMVPAADVGGDYYDILSFDGVSWIAIGDVSGHGLTAGLVMLQAQSAVSALIRQRPSATPREILGQANAVLCENVRTRLRQDEFMTMSLLCYDGNGHVVLAGAHEEFLVCRAADGKCERVPTKGTWLGVKRGVERFMEETEVTLLEGDLLVLYTDGITEARSDTREQFGLDRLATTVENVRNETVASIRTHVLDSVRDWAARQEDDMTLVLLRYTGHA
jgi:serine phosphatase RsbU (regulator of sigma subunit)